MLSLLIFMCVMYMQYQRRLDPLELELKMFFIFCAIARNWTPPFRKSIKSSWCWTSSYTLHSIYITGTFINSLTIEIFNLDQILYLFIGNHSYISYVLSSSCEIISHLNFLVLSDCQIPALYNKKILVVKIIGEFAIHWEDAALGGNHH